MSQDDFEDTQGVIRTRNRRKTDNGQKENDKRTDSNLHIKHKIELLESTKNPG